MVDMAILGCAVYKDGKREKDNLDLREAREACSRHDDAFVWIGLKDPTEEEFDSVTGEFDLHELAVEDAIKAHQRPKLEHYGDTLFMVLKTACYHDKTETVDIGEINIFVGKSFLITVRHGEASALDGVRKAADERPELLQSGPGAVLHAIVDRVVDDYSPVIDGVQDDIEELEEQVFSAERVNPTQRIYKLKREVLQLHRATAPLVEPLDELAAGRVGLVGPEVHEYFRDVYDHIVRADEQVEGLREGLNGIVQSNLAQVGVRQNEDMRKISAWVAIIAIPTAVAGIYGMNFDHMPELHWRFGYAYALALMAVSCFVLWRYFKKVGWL
jgi:magnesium transporter